MKVNSLFRQFKLQKIHMAIVKTAHGEVTGVVTMNDILDTLFEELFSEEENPETDRAQFSRLRGKK
jgi:putative hemolysin